MTYTAHGHHINGTIKNKHDSPVSVARCGGPGLCESCSKQAVQVLNQQSNKELDLDNCLFMEAGWDGKNVISFSADEEVAARVAESVSNVNIFAVRAI